MALVRLDTLRSRARTRADMVNSQFVSDSELDAFINASADELYDLLVVSFEDYFAKESTFNTVADTATVALPSDFYKLLGVDLTVSGDKLALQPFSFHDRNRYDNDWARAFRPNRYRYRVEGANIRLLPTPDGVYSGSIWYIPTRTQLTVISDTLDGVSGWEEYVVVDAAAKCIIKEEGDPSALLAEKAALHRRIEVSADRRDATLPGRVTDVWAEEWD